MWVWRSDAPLRCLQSCCCCCCWWWWWWWLPVSLLEDFKIWKIGIVVGWKDGKKILPNPHCFQWCLCCRFWGNIWRHLKYRWWFYFTSTAQGEVSISIDIFQNRLKSPCNCMALDLGIFCFFWTTIADGPAARAYHSAVHWRNGALVIFGGVTRPGVAPRWHQLARWGIRDGMLKYPYYSLEVYYKLVPGKKLPGSLTAKVPGRKLVVGMVTFQGLLG